MNTAALCLVLHAHLPFVRHLQAGVFLEENWLSEAVLECYIPLLQMLDRLERDGVPGSLTFTLTPTLCAMLADPMLQNRVRERLGRLARLTEDESRRFADDPDVQPLTAHYRERLTAACGYLADAGNNLLPCFRRHYESGRLEIITCAATHALLPMLADTRAVDRQIAVGVRAHIAAFGRPPRGIWLPECAYFPDAAAVLRKHGIEFTILAAHAFLYAAPRPGLGVYAPLRTPEGLFVFGRDPECSRQVWSAADGYPGDALYREFYRDRGWDAPLADVDPYLLRPGLRHDLGLKYHRITGTADLARKEYYRPDAAAAQARVHAADFLRRRAAQVAGLTAQFGKPPVITAPYDAELFGHWWYEGPLFLEAVIREAAAAAAQTSAPELTLVSPASLLTSPAQTAVPAVSSWGDRGYFSTWLNGDTDWIYPELYAAQDLVNTAEELLAGGAPAWQKQTLRQMQRELLLAQSSDWPFIITNRTMADYARRRLNTHLANVRTLAAMLRDGAADMTLLAALEDENNIFSPEILDAAGSGQ